MTKPSRNPSIGSDRSNEKSAQKHRAFVEIQNKPKKAKKDIKSS